MTTLVVRHTVKDFDAWSPVFKEQGDIRRGHGATRERVLRDGNDVLVLIDFPDTEAAQSFRTDPSLREAMHRAGVVGAPDITLWAEVSEELY